MNGYPARLAAALVTLMLVGACSREHSSADVLVEAKTAMTKHDFRAAGIRLRTLLEKEPNSAQARLLFGMSLVEIGEPAFAVVELRKALELAVPRPDVVPVLARAILLSGSAKSVVEEFGKQELGRADADADLQTTLAKAYGALRRRPDAQDAIERALRLAPDFSPAIVVQARLRAEAGDHAAAVAQLQQLLVKVPANSEAWRMLGDVQTYGLNDIKAGLTSYAKAVEVGPVDLAANNALIYTLVQERKIKEAELAFAQMRTHFQGHPQVRFFEALFAFNKRDHKLARERLQLLLERAPGNIWFLQLAGANEFAAGALVQSEAHLSKALQLHPDSVQVRGALARVYMAGGQPQRAIEVLQPLLTVSNPGAGALAIVAEAFLESGDAARAAELFGQAVKARPDELDFRIGQARAGLASGQSAQALATLGELAATQDKGITADTLLVQALVGRGDLAGAAKAAEALQAKRPKAAFAANIRGEIALRAGDLVAARQRFEQALSLSPAHLPAAVGLSAIELQAGKGEAAQQRLTAFTAANPKSMPALLALAETQAVLRVRPADIGATISRAVELAPDDVRPRAALIRHFLRQRDTQRARAAAQEAVSRLPRSTELLDLLAQAQFFNGELQQATTTIGRWSASVPKSPLPHVRLGDLLAGKGDFEAALASYRKARLLAPGVIDIPASMIKANLAARRPDQALDVAKDFVRQHPEAMVGHLMLGDVHMAGKNFPQAIASYRAAAAKPDATSAATDKLYQTLQLAGQRDAAEQVIIAWRKAHPQDVSVSFNAGNLALAKAQHAAAETHFRAVLAIKADNAPALNNLALALIGQGRQDAVPLAEKAVSLVPESPQMLDTLAAALAANGQYERAIEAQRRALAKPGGQQPDYQLRLAKILLRAGQKPQAVEVLKALADLPGKPAAAVEAADLLKSAAAV